MSSIMRWRSALPGRCEGSEVIGGSSLELKVAGPSMLGIGCPDRHALLLMPFPSAAAERTHPEAAPSRESGFVLWPFADMQCRKPVISALGESVPATPAAI